MRKKGLALIVAMIMVAGMVMPVFAASMPFADVPKDHWAYDSVAELTASGLIIGYPDGTFKGERQFTRYEMAMVFARVLGRLDTLIGAELNAGIRGLSDDIYAEVAKALTEELAKAKDELSAHVDTELANVELPEVKVVERIVEQPVEVALPFELTDEAKAVIAKVVADMVAENVASLEPQVVEKLVEAEPGLTAKDLQGLMAAVANAQSTADFNTMDIEELKAEVAAARKLIDDIEFQAKVTDALLDAAERKADNALAVGEAARSEAAEAKADAAAANTAAAIAKVTATEAIAVGTSATDQALAALKGVEDANVAIEATNQEVRNLAIAIAALEGDVATVQVLLEDTARALESDIAALTEEFGAELASLGVRLDDLETIVVDNTRRIDALEADLAEHKAEVLDDIIDLRMADLFLQEDIADVADAQAETAEQLAVVDAEQKATAADFADFKADHEKVKLSGSTKTVFSNVGIVADFTQDWEGDDNDEFFKDPRERDDEETYKRESKLQQEFVLNLEATPAEGVLVKASLADTLNVFGDTDDEKPGLDLSNISLELTTDKALRSLYAGSRDLEDIAARYNEFIIEDDNDDREDAEVLAANVVLGKLDTEIVLMRPWEQWNEDDELEGRESKYAALVNSAYALSDAFVVDLQYARIWGDPSAQKLKLEGEPENDWAYSLGLRGELAFADYSAAYVANKAEQTGYRFSVGKAYGPAPEEDEDDLRPTWDITYRATGEDGFESYLAGEPLGDFKNTLSLSADNFKLVGLNLGAGYKAKKDLDNEDKDVRAMKFSVGKDDLLLKGLSVSGQYTKITNEALIDDGSSLLGKIAYEPTFGGLELSASYEYTTNAIDGDFDNPAKWLETENNNKAVPESTVALSAQYPFEVLDTTITPFVGYEKRVSDEIEYRDYVDPLMTYKISAKRALGSATAEASYRYRSGGHPGKEGEMPELDKTADVKLTYPVVGDADLELGYRWMDVKAYNPDWDYTVNEVNAGLKFTF